MLFSHFSRGRIERYLAEGLPPVEEVALRQHLRDCLRCRAVYDDSVHLLRGLAGDPASPTRAEHERAVSRALAVASLPSLAPTAMSLPSPSASPSASPTNRSSSPPSSSGRRRWLWLLPVATLGALVGALMLSPGSRAPVAAGHIVAAEDVSVDGRPVVAGAALLPGARVSVGPRGLADVEVARGGHVRLYSLATAWFSSRGEEVELIEGKLWAVVERGRGSFRVHTDRADARVLGTSFLVEKVDGGDTEVRVASGTVEVEDARHNGIVRVEGGHSTRVGASGAPARVRRYDATRDQDDWDRLLHQIGRTIDRALRSIGDHLK